MNNSKSIKNEETIHEIMKYGALIRDIRDSAEQLHSIWQDEAGDRICDRIRDLTDEMNENYEGLRLWIGSGSL